MKTKEPISIRLPFTSKTLAIMGGFVFFFWGWHLVQWIMFDPQTAMAFPVKARDIALLGLVIWYFLDRKSPLWSHTRKLLFQKWKTWPAALALSIPFIFLSRVYMGVISSWLPNSFNAKFDLSSVSFSVLTLDNINNAFIEELIYKLFLLLILPKTVGMWGYLFVYTVLFSTMHISYGFASIFFYSIFAVPTGLYFCKSGNLGALVVFHFGVNMFMGFPFHKLVSQ